MPSLVFLGIGDLGWAQKTKDFEHGQRYPVDEEHPRGWFAPELVKAKARNVTRDVGAPPVITSFSEQTDIFALGYIPHKLCGHFFNMTLVEKHEYNLEFFKRGYPAKFIEPVVAHAVVLENEINLIMSPSIGASKNRRKSEAYYANAFEDQMMISPFVRSRPIETTSWATVDPYSKGANV